MDELATILTQGPPPLFATISGAHLYGFDSPDSDVDLRGAFVLSLDDVLGLDQPKETLTVSRIENGRELDWVAHDVKKFLELMTRRNGYVLEQLYSPLVVHGGPWHDELKQLGAGCIVRPVYFHYRGFLHNQRKTVETVKDLLYAYRVALTGIHLLRSGRVEANLERLQPPAGVGELIARKREGQEKAQLEPGEAEAHAPALERLAQELEEAHQASKLPEQVTNRKALSDFLVRARKALG